MRLARRRALLPTIAAIAVALARAEPSLADGTSFGLYRQPIEGKIRGVRAADLDGDGKKDLVVLVESKRADGVPQQDVLVLRTPATPTPKTFFDLNAPATVLRIPCDGPDAGTRAHAAVVAIGRFGPKGAKNAVRLRFIGSDGVSDVAVADGKPVGSEVAGTSLLSRGPGSSLAFWDAVADLDGDGTDECWWPNASGRVAVGGLSLPVLEEGQSTTSLLAVRKSRTPSLTPADVDGDGIKELVRLDGSALVIEKPSAAGGPAGAAVRVELPFLARDPDRPANELHAPRLSLADVDGDGKTDLLVTLVHGRADVPNGLRTSLYHIPGPFVDRKTGALAEPKTRLDTESVALHPRFVDVNGDGKLDYVADSIRGTMLDLIKRVMGTEPEITFTIVRFDPETGTFEPSPYATFVRPYSGAEARGNRFGRSGYFEGDFDGDGFKDLLDLGNLRGVSVWRGRNGESAFGDRLLPRVPIDGDKDLVSDAVIADLDGDGRSDAVMWTEDALLVAMPRAGK